MRIGIAALATLCGCNAFFDLRPTISSDAADVDLDDDGVDDYIDNCPAIANTQADEDVDGVGDHCDNCPLQENTRQEDGDGDSIGDVCDPHPITRGDCLVVFDSFSDPTVFASHWDILSSGSAPTITPAAGSVRIETAADGRALFLARGANDVFDVQLSLRVSLQTPTAQAVAVTGTTAFGSTFWCDISNPTTMPNPQLRLQVFSSTNSGSSGANMTTPAVGDRLAFRLTAKASDGRTVPNCFVNYGYSRGLADLMYISPIPQLTGSFGAGFADGGAGDVFAIAAYRFDPLAAACSPAVVR